MRFDKEDEIMNKIEHLPQTVRVWIPCQDRPEVYALIVPNPRNGEYFRDFFLVDDATGSAVYMFGAPAQSDTLAAELAEIAAAQHIQDLERVEC